MNKEIYLLFVWVLLACSSCSKSDSGTVLTHQYNATVRVTVSEYIDVNGNLVDSLVAGAEVDLYETKEDRDLALPPDYSKTTGFDGMAEFLNLDKDYYYLRIINPHTQAVMKDETNTPDGTISFVDVTFQ